MDIVLEEKAEPIKSLKCGIVMPISRHDGYSQDHWKDVLNILTSAVDETEFESFLVSDDSAIGLIHERIVTNLYYNDIVICDVSSKNPNVMFELGLRLAFDKPTVIIKDDMTEYSFDVGGIEHLPYPSSLRFANIVDFKNALIMKINSTFQRSKSDKEYSPFLKSFGKRIVPAKITGEEITQSTFIIEALKDLQLEFRQFRSRSASSVIYPSLDVTEDSYNILSKAITDFVKRNDVSRNDTISFAKDFAKNTNIRIDESSILRLIDSEINIAMTNRLKKQRL